MEYYESYFKYVGLKYKIDKYHCPRILFVVPTNTTFMLYLKFMRFHEVDEFSWNPKNNRVVQGSKFNKRVLFLVRTRNT